MIKNVCHNVWSPYVFAKVKELLMGSEIPWYLCVTDYYNENKDQNSHKWQHIAYHKGVGSSFVGPYLEMAVWDALSKSGQDVDELIRIRCSVTEIVNQHYVGGAHVDTDTPHMTALFYINDSDGDTILYNEKFDPDLGLNQYDYYKQIVKEPTVKHTVTPEANKMFWFDGLYYHSSNSPTSVSKRFIINVNYTLKKKQNEC
jgi:hypothetical protein